MKRGILIVLISLLAGGCKKKTDPVVSAVVVPSTAPSQTMRGFTMIDFQNGTKSMTLEAVEARLFEARHMAELEQPDTVFFKAGKQSSRLTAPKGRVDTETHHVEAWGGVKVVTVDSDTLTTDSLYYDPVKRVIKTDLPVRLERPDSITDGIGLESDPELQKVRIGKQKVRFK